MATIRGLKVLLFLGIFMFFVSKGAVSYAQGNVTHDNATINNDLTVKKITQNIAHSW